MSEKSKVGTLGGSETSNQQFREGYQPLERGYQPTTSTLDPKNPPGGGQGQGGGQGSGQTQDASSSGGGQSSSTDKS